MFRPEQGIRPAGQGIRRAGWRRAEPHRFDASSPITGRQPSVIHGACKISIMKPVAIFRGWIGAASGAMPRARRARRLSQDRKASIVGEGTAYSKSSGTGAVLRFAIGILLNII
jgi:hypothetical protein